MKEFVGKLIEMSEQEKRKVLKFDGLGIVSEFPDKEKGYRFSVDAKIGKWYKIHYNEVQKEGQQFPYRNLAKEIEETEAAQSSGSRDETYWIKKDRTMSKLGCLRDSIAYFQILADLEQIKKVEIDQVAAMAKAMHEAITSDDDEFNIEFEKFYKKTEG